MRRVRLFAPTDQQIFVFALGPTFAEGTITSSY